MRELFTRKDINDVIEVHQMKFHDAHCHIPNKSFLKDFDIDESITKWTKMGMEFVVGVSTKLTECQKIVELSKKYYEIIPSFGIHPWGCKKPLTEEIKTKIRTLVEDNPISVLGEIGLDRHFIKKVEYYPIQEEYFRFFLELSVEYKRPVNIHLKGAEEEVSNILTDYDIPSHNTNIHWFSGPNQILDEFIERDYFFSINPSILSGSPHITVLQKASMNRILTESDGNVKYTIDDARIIGSPAIIPKTIDKIAEIKNESKEVISVQLQTNLRRYLNLN